MTAIDRLRRCLSNPVIPNQYDEDARDALAAVDALYQEAKNVTEYMSDNRLGVLAAAVRRVEGQA